MDSEQRKVEVTRCFSRTDVDVGVVNAKVQERQQAEPEFGTDVIGEGLARFVGYRKGDDLADHYAAADLFAFASVTETFGNVVLEAMASGLPVVAIRAGGPGEIVRDGETGALIGPDATPTDFAAALIQLVDDAGKRRTMAHAARNYAVSQSWDTIMESLRGRYLAILGRTTFASSTPEG
jgi:glycosyltransferase involved in cell wall biosynthesis